MCVSIGALLDEINMWDYARVYMYRHVCVSVCAFLDEFNLWDCISLHV